MLKRRLGVFRIWASCVVPMRGRSVSLPQFRNTAERITKTTTKEAYSTTACLSAIPQTQRICKKPQPKRRRCNHR
ncbi:hypothetical protein QBC42DRAFT_260154 [Cladorrhinum samala]|uniref:Secreted protein n=1 Tax=Cladorrhinum samala TaxID=585594 RepID=A0AAV9I110_9PEZI|nr:hypothetical protein QBC42DRAFT_260154 [Cladorrhinum samala]